MLSALRLVPCPAAQSTTLLSNSSVLTCKGIPLYLGSRANASLPCSPVSTFSSSGVKPEGLPTYHGGRLSLASDFRPTRSSFTRLEESVDTKDAVNNLGSFQFTPLYPPGQLVMPACVAMFRPRSHV